MALLDFIEAIEIAVGAKAGCNLLPMQLGDVLSTWASTALLERSTGFKPEASLEDGVAKFVEWHRGYFDR